MNRNILYLSYDGMTDPLGQSQVIPYLLGLSAHGYRFTILSFEKSERYAAHHRSIEQILEKAGIEWVPLTFTRNPPLVSKFYDALRMRKTAYALHRSRRFDMVHCRSYIAADIGLRMKKKFGTKFFFDMRGFWADEKRDGGAWKDGHPVFSRVYKYYKGKEAEYLRHADHIISLTDAGRREMERWPAYRASVPVSVIPCCADMNLFSLTDMQQRTAARELLGIAADALVISYLGSVGAWYMLDEMLELFSRIKNKYPSAIFLFITHSDPQMVRSRATGHGISSNDLLVREATRQEVPVLMKASDLSVSFIKPVYSKLSSSPTKLGEVLSMGIPVIVNAGVGDVKETVLEAGAGFVMEHFEPADYEMAIAHIPSLLAVGPATIRKNVESRFDLQKGITKYINAYESVFQ